MADLPTPEAVIPHRPPFLFLTEVTELIQGESAAGYWQLTGEEWFFEGHFPGRPTLPGVLMCEAIAQLGAYAVLQTSEFDGKIPLFGSLDKAKFRRQVVPGDRLDLAITVERLSARGGKAIGQASVNGEVACTCDVMFVGVPA